MPFGTKSSSTHFHPVASDLFLYLMFETFQRQLMVNRLKQYKKDDGSRGRKYLSVSFRKVEEMFLQPFNNLSTKRKYET